jgi:hypothetical protein
MGAFKEFLSETNLARVYHHTQHSNIGIITAHRAGEKPEVNRSRNADLENDIRKAGYGYMHVRGQSIEKDKTTGENRTASEHSYIVIGNDKDSGNLKGWLKHHGQKYGQDSVLHKAHDEENAKLIGTSEGGHPGMGKEEDLGKWHPNRMAQYHTKLHNGKVFAFEGIGFYSPKSWFSRKEKLFD